MTQQEYLQHVQTVAIAQLEEGDELIMSLEVSRTRTYANSQKRPWLNKWLKKAYDATKVNTEENNPCGLQATLENLFGTRGPVNYHLTENTTTELNYDRMPPTS